MLSRCNEALVKAHLEEDLLNEICQIIVELGGYKLAWIGFAENNEEKTVRPVAQKGFEEGYLNTVNITWGDGERGQGPTGKAIRTGKPHIIKNILNDPNYVPWREQASKRGYRSSIALPIITGGTVSGALNVYSEEQDAFDEEEIALLMRLASDLAFGITALRTQIEGKLVEQELKQYRDRLEELVLRRSIALEEVNKQLQIVTTEIDHIFNISVPICLIDKDHNLLRFNDPFCAFFEVQKEKILGKKCHEIKGTPFCGTNQCTIEKLSQGAAINEYEVEFNLSSNNRKSCIISARPYRSADGDFIGVVECFIDITARKKAEDDLQKLEERYRILLENAQEGIWAIDKNDTTTFVNQRMADILGYTRAEMLGRPLFSFMDEQGIELAKKLLKRQKEGLGKNHDFEFLRKNGTRIYTRIETGPIMENDGTYIGAIACVADVTDQRHAEEELRKSEEKFRTLFNSASDSITICDLEGRFLEINDVICERLGYRREELLKMSINEINLPEYADLIPQRIIDVTKQGYALFETVHRRKDGTVIPIELNSRIIDYLGQKAILSIARDITDRKKFENIQKQFISTVSHELRTPISVISQSISNLQKYSDKLTEDQRKKLTNSILRNSDLLAELINDLLLISQIDEQKLKLEWRSYSPFNILQGVLDQLEPKRSAKEIDIEFEVDQNIQLFGDPKKVGEIFRILLDNTLKYSANNTKIQIKATNHYRGNYNSKDTEGLLIQFTDSGRGIRPEEIPHLFTRFFRSDEVKNIPGTGLGLSIALNLIQLHRGEIHVESTYGKGTTFFLFLPLLEKNPLLEN